MNRRGFLGSILALGVAPAIVRSTSLMPIRALSPGLPLAEQISDWNLVMQAIKAGTLHLLPKGTYKLDKPLDIRDMKHVHLDFGPGIVLQLAPNVPNAINLHGKMENVIISNLQLEGPHSRLLLPEDASLATKPIDLKFSSS